MAFIAAGASVNAKYQGRVNGIINRLDAKICDGYVADGCPVATPGCQAVGAVCIENRCESAFIVPLPRPHPQPEELPDRASLDLQETR